MRSKQILPLLTVFALVAAVANAVEGDDNEKNLKKGQEDEHVQLIERGFSFFFGNSNTGCRSYCKPYARKCPEGHCIGEGYKNLSEANASRFTDSDTIEIVRGWIPEWTLPLLVNDTYISNKSQDIFVQVPESLSCRKACECYTGHPGSYKKYDTLECVKEVERVRRWHGFFSYEYVNATVHKWKKRTGYFCKCEKKIDEKGFLVDSFLNGRFCKPR